ncbi:MAG: glutamate-1-semialdehyde 2,1-aminomutase [Sandaracinaceae bacterium]|nr:glutamate-1-semialdehyde 2,1-aminomutase [Sandaracinaceae bacterium]
MSDPVSRELFEKAKRWMPGGVSSPVRAFKAVGGTPVFVDRAEGPYLYGADGTRYVDYVGSWGPAILGHAHPGVVKAVQDAAARGASYGAPTAQEAELAELVASFFPSVEMIRFVSSGTEAVMGALRAARGFTGRDLVVKLEGCYHGGADYLLVKAGSGLATFGVPTSAGVPEAIAGTTRVAPFNDVAAIEALFEQEGEKIAALILEPVVGNMGTVAPEPGYLEALRAITARHGALLVFDEVMTGFRVAPGGAQELYGVTPDLTTLGKILGGGLPMGAYGGRRDVMSRVAPDGPVYQAGTLSGNPLAVAAGLATLRALREGGVYDRLEQASARLERAFADAAAERDAPITVQRVGSMLTPFFRRGAVRRWEDAAGCDTAAFGRWHAAMIANGVHWPPAQFEAGFVSMAHDEDALAATERAFERALDAL